MLMKRLTSIIYLLIIFFLPVNIFGSGFMMNEHGAKASAMAGAFAAQADDPSALYYNPAGIVQLEGLQCASSLYILFPSGSFKSDSTNTSIGTYAGKKTNSVKHTFYIPALYATYQLNEKLHFGFCEFTNFGLTNEWPEDWEGRYTFGGIKSTVATLSLNPVVAWRPIKKFSLSVGPVFQHMAFELSSKTSYLAGLPDIDIKLKGEDNNWGWNLGLLYFLNSDIKIGFSYRSEIKHKFTDASIEISGESTDGKKATFNLPASAFLGASYNKKRFTVEFDVQWTNWAIEKELTAEVGIPGMESISEKLNWKNAISWRFGIQYELNDIFDIRGGYLFDERIIPKETITPFFPDNNRHLFAIGTGYNKESYAIDLTYSYVLIENQIYNNESGDFDSDPYPGTTGKISGKFQNIDIHILVITINYKF